MPNVIILHGYSDRRESFVPLQQFLAANGFAVTDIVLGNYISLEDHITIEDLAKAFQLILSAKGVLAQPGSINLIVHSTGALVAREWLTRYYLEAGKECPLRRLLMLAPANFGSPLAALGRTMFARIVRGWQTNFETGTHILEALEMGSAYSWKLAQRDLFGPRSFYVPDTCLSAILVGSQPYQGASRQLIDKDGSDGTVYVCTANLNATGLSVRFGANNQVPTFQSWPKSAGPIPLAVFPNRDHASIVRPDTLDPELGTFILKFLRLELPDHAEFANACDARTRQTLPASPDKRLFHTFQNLVTRVTDDLGMSIPDYAFSYLIPRQLEAHGLTAGQLEIAPAAVRLVIASYTREAGLRNLEREIASLCRGAAREIAEGLKTQVAINEADVAQYLGPPKFFRDAALEHPEPGVATGLAWTPSGGDILFIEVLRMPGNGSLKLTGQLGDVMKESATAALSYIRARAPFLGIAEDFFDKADLHIHVPAGSIPKDGPSAGVALLCALVSLLSNRPIKKDLAMTGEITLRGHVLPVGGIKNKVLAAHRAGIKEIILPAQNQVDLEEIPPSVREELTFHPVERLDQALEIAFPPRE